ncbi:MAG: hypothetical protein H0Z38_02770 [Firmicutes bacterium]|nr:hypothetical protein [Bacillota bacterium]
MNIILTSNSPGEISGWVKPVVGEISRGWPGANVYLFILPCSFASGQECSVAANISGIKEVFPARDYWRLVLTGRRPAGYQHAEEGLVLFLGGDQTHAVLIGSRLQYPVYVYTEGRALWPKRVQKYFVPYPEALAKVKEKAPGKGELVGNIMLDAVKPTMSRDAFRRDLGLKTHEPLVALFPGSRPGEFSYIAGFFCEATELLKRELPAVRFVVSLSPFIPDALAREAFPQDRFRDMILLKGRQYDIMHSADLALTIPGTNTAEMAFEGLPMVVSVPLNRPELIPLEGLPGLIGGLPLIGKPLKRRAVQAVNAKLKYTALPNILAKEEIIPELRGDVTPADLAQAAHELLSDEERRREMAERLKAVIGPAGAARRLVNALQKLTGYGDYVNEI